MPVTKLSTKIITDVKYLRNDEHLMGGRVHEAVAWEYVALLSWTGFLLSRRHRNPQALALKQNIYIFS